MTDLRALREAAEKATKGEWESGSERSDGCYGAGPDCREGYQSFAVFVDGEKICDALNSDVGCVHEEHDEDGCYAWDDVAKRNMAFIALANPAAIIALLDRLKEAEEALALIKGETRGCSQDMGFDREIGPLGCALGDNCVCAPVHMIARAHLERHNNE